jgi:hypothetical protein
MAYGSVGSLGTNQEKTSDTQIVLAVTANAEVGNLIVVWVAMDNEGTADANTAQLSCADDAGNIYVKLHERTESSGAANDGAVIAMFATVVKTQLNSGSNITVTSTSARTAKAISAWEFTTGSSGFQIQAVTQANATNTDPAAVTLSSLPSREYLLLWGFGSENIVPVSTHDADYTAINDISTSGSTADTNITVDGAFRIATLTTDTVDAATASTTQHAQVYAAIYESAVSNRISQAPVEVLVLPNTQTARISQAPVEVLVTKDGPNYPQVVMT